MKSNNSESLLTESFDIDSAILVKPEVHFDKDDNELLSVDSHTLLRPLECGPSSMPAVNELTPEAEADGDKCLGRQPLAAIGNLGQRQVDGPGKGHDQRDDSELCSHTVGCTWQV